MIAQSAVSRSLPRAVGFLVEQQSANGAWRDFRLEPGRSDAWVTAYVGVKLLQVARRAYDGLAPALAAAARFLDGARDRNGGWCYNARVAPDADSTAWAILFLRGMGGSVPLRDYAALAKFQLSDGAFATYRNVGSLHGWGRGHPDVTILALAALGCALPPDHVILRKGHASLDAYLGGPHPLASYWWPSPFYMARELLTLSRAFPQARSFSTPIPMLPADAGCFERALALEVDVLRGVARNRTSRALSRLHFLQLPDGSWPSAPILRVAKPRSIEPDDVHCRRSPVFADDRRIFTTAAVAAAIDFAEATVR
jgi:hypothetical protein